MTIYNYDAIKAELDAARDHRLEVLCCCELLVERWAAEGNEEAAALAELTAESRRRNQAAILEAQLSLPAAPHRL